MADNNGTAERPAGKAPALATAGKPSVRQDVQRPIKDSRRAQIEAGLQAFHETANEVEQLKETIEQQRITLAEKDIEISGLRRQAEDIQRLMDMTVSQADSKVASYMAERDQAIGERAAVEVILISVKRIIDLARLPPTVIPDLKARAEPEAEPPREEH